MNKNDICELVLILDRSGSMSILESDTIGGYNSMLSQQREEEGKALVTTVLFDHEYELLHDRVDISTVKDITNREYYARGTTALLDAVGKTINYISVKQDALAPKEKPNRTLFVIITDGYENASTEFSQPQIKALIERKREESDWEFIFLGANIDAVSTADTYGIRRDMAATYTADERGTELNFKAVSNVMSSVRYAREIDETWKDEIEEYISAKKH